MKKLVSKLLVALGLLTSGGAWAQTLDNVKVTATWAFDLGTSDQVAVLTDVSDADVTESYLKESNVALGSNFSWGTKKELTNANPEGETVIETSVVCARKQNNPLTDGTQYIDFLITPKKGLTFTPTSVSFRATRHGTNGGYMNIYWLNSDGTTKELATKKMANRETTLNEKKEKTDYKYTDYSYTVSGANASDGASGLRIQLYALDGTKHYGFCNIVITGTLSGTIEEEVTYTVTKDVTPAGAGSITQSPVGTKITAGENVTFTPVANAGYTFLNKWTVNGEEIEGATYTISSISADATVVAQFEKNPVLSYAKPEGVYCVNRMFPAGVNTVVKGGTTTLPAANYMYYKEGYTMTGWNVGGTNYDFGAEVTLTEDVTAEPVFAANNTILEARKSDVTVTYDFNQTSNGGRVVNIEGNADKVITRITVDGEEIDYAMDADCQKGKLNNTKGTTAQCNQGTVLNIHDVEVGSVITLTCNTDNVFTNETTFNGVGGTPDGKSITYTATEAGDVKVIVANSNVFLTSITITYPYVAPTMSYEFKAEDTDFYTLYWDYPVTIPEKVKAYTGKLSGNNLILTEITDGFIAAKSAVILKAEEAGSYTFTYNDSNEAFSAKYEDNDLLGVPVDTPIADLYATGTVLTLGRNEEGVLGFRNPYETYVSAHKAYIDYVPTSSASFVQILFGEATGIEAIQSVKNQTADGAMFNIMGQRVDANAKGLILMNGKKVIRK